MVLMGAVYACVVGLIFMPLMQVYPEELKPLWPYLFMGVIFICLLVGQVSLFEQDYQDGFLEWYAVHRPHLRGYLITKYAAHGSLMITVLLAVTALFGWGMMTRHMLITLLVIQAISIATLSALHMVISSVLLKARAYWRFIVQMVILIPLAVPVVLLSYGVLEAGQFIFPQNNLFVLFISLSIATIVGALAITPLALREALRD